MRVTISVSMIVVVSLFHSSFCLGETRDIVVDGASLDNPVGVGYGHWEGTEPLVINLSASDPKEIATVNVYLPEDVIWYGSDASAPDPWTYETSAIKPDEGFATIFRGTLKSIGGGGQGVPPVAPEWAAAVSDIDLDCDSDNDSTETYRPPETGSQGAAEDAVEVSRRGKLIRTKRHGDEQGGGLGTDEAYRSYQKERHCIIPS